MSRPKLLKKFDCYITCVESSSFWLRTDYRDYEQRVDVASIRKSMFPRVREGFFWTFLVYENGIRVRPKKLRYWTEATLRTARRQARKLVKDLKLAVGQDGNFEL